MKKKLLGLIIAAIMLFVPMGVNAEEFYDWNGCKYPIHTNYYLFHSYVAKFSLVNGEYLYQSTDTARFNDNINGSIIHAYSGKVDLSDSEFDVDDYFEIWFKILEKNTNGYKINTTSITDSSNKYVKYNIHEKYETETTSGIEHSYPFFWYSNMGTSNTDDDFIYNNLTYNQKVSLKNNIRNSAYLVDNTEMERSNDKDNNQILFEIQRNFQITESDMDKCVDMSSYYGDDTYCYVVVPEVYKISYYVDGEGVCTEDANKTQYTVKYHKNDGSDSTNEISLKSGASHIIKENWYERSGYKFVGWSTDKDATEANETYAPGKTHTINSNLDLYAVWLNTGGGKEQGEQGKYGLGYSIGIIAVILAATGAGVVYFKKRNKFENI